MGTVQYVKLHEYCISNDLLSVSTKFMQKSQRDSAKNFQTEQ